MTKTHARAILKAINHMMISDGVYQIYTRGGILFEVYNYGVKNMGKKPYQETFMREELGRRLIEEARKTLGKEFKTHFSIPRK